MIANAWRARTAAILLTAAACSPLSTKADDFPDKTVRLAVPFPAGGATDLIARVVAQQLSVAWRQPVISDNIPGATGTIAAAQIARAAPDGYNLSLEQDR